MRPIEVSGHVEPAFEGVRHAFVENFVNKKTGEPWERDTMVIVWSATKGMSGLAIALAESRGLLDYDERVPKALGLPKCSHPDPGLGLTKPKESSQVTLA